MFWKLGSREIRQHPGRAMLTLASVVHCRRGVVAVGFAGQTDPPRIRRHLSDDCRSRRLWKSPRKSATRSTNVSWTRSVHLPGVKAAVPLLHRRTIMYVGRQSRQLTVLGIDPQRDPAVRDLSSWRARRWREANGIMLTTEFADTLGLKVDDQVESAHPSRQEVYACRRPVQAPGHSDHRPRGRDVDATLRSPGLFRVGKHLDTIQIVLEPGADEEQVRTEIAKRLPEGVTVRRPAARSQMAEETALSTQQGLNMSRIFSLLVAVFIIANTFLMSVTQLRKQLGIMRAIGATRGQVARLVMQQAVLMGVVGTIFGSVLGVFAAEALSRAMGALYVTTLPPIELVPGPFIWAAAVGFGISFFGAALPAWRATQASPMDCDSRYPARRHRRRGPLARHSRRDFSRNRECCAGDQHRRQVADGGVGLGSSDLVVRPRVDASPRAATFVADRNPGC